MNDLNILEIRKSLKMTQIEFGELIGADRRTIINYEQGKKIPATKRKVIEMIMASNISSSTSKDNASGDVENLRIENLDLKDHIKTLKQLIEEKDKLTEIYKNENLLLKEKIELLTKNQSINTEKSN